MATPFSCASDALAVLESPAAPAPPPYTLALGMGVRDPNTRHALEMLRRHQATWMPRTWLGHLLMYQCGRSAPAWLANVSSHCVSTWPERLIHNYRLGAELLRLLYERMPNYRFYAKIDLDTIVYPEALALYLQAHAADELHYFGSIESTHRQRRVPRAHCATFGYCQPFDYAQGGFEGLSHKALRAVVTGGCFDRIGAVPCGDDKLCVWHAEDAALGVCAAMLGFKLTTCACFFPWGPCSVYNTSSCARRLCERPLSIHKVKKADWFDRWWPLGRGVSGVFSLSRGG